MKLGKYEDHTGINHVFLLLTYISSQSVQHMSLINKYLKLYGKITFLFQVDVRTIHGSTPLCNACASGSLECAKLLLKYGAKVNPSLTALTASPLHEACIQGNPSAAMRQGSTSQMSSLN